MAPAPLPHRSYRADDGVAMISVIMLLVLVSALTLTLAVVTTNNLISSRNAQQAGAALNASDAGIAQGVTYLRQNGVKVLNSCSPACASEPWGNKNNPAQVTIPGASGQRYRVWIEVISPFPTNKPGVYRIHSRGTSGGPAGRTTTLDVALDSYKFPLGIVANTVSGGGTADVHRVSIFSLGCVYRRDKIVFEGTDVSYGIPAAVHSSQVITDSNGSGRFCPSTSKPIHDTTKPPALRNCNTAYPYDQDRNGGDLVGTPCYGLSGGTYPTTSFIDEAQLASLYGVKRPVFTQAQLDHLKTIAISQQSYYTSSTGWSSPTLPSSVLYFDLTATDPGGVVDLNNVTGWSRPVPLTAGAAECPARSLLIIIEGGNARLNSNSVLAASTFLISEDPYGNVLKANGTSTYIGTLYANNLDLTGTTDMWMDECSAFNISPALTDLVTYNYREVDR